MVNTSYSTYCFWNQKNANNMRNLNIFLYMDRGADIKPLKKYSETALSHKLNSRSFDFAIASRSEEKIKDSL